MVKVNGEILALDGKTTEEYLQAAGYDGKRVAVELNGEILPKAEYERRILQEGDCLEIVQFVGGG